MRPLLTSEEYEATKAVRIKKKIITIPLLLLFLSLLSGCESISPGSGLETATAAKAKVTVLNSLLSGHQLLLIGMS